MPENRLQTKIWTVAKQRAVNRLHYQTVNKILKSCKTKVQSTQERLAKGAKRNELPKEPQQNATERESQMPENRLHHQNCKQNFEQNFERVEKERPGELKQRFVKKATKTELFPKIAAANFH